MMRFDVTQYWYRQQLHPLMLMLLPFSWLFGACAAVRRLLFRTGMIKSYHSDIPVIVVGNITTGGTGKTPFVIWLATFLKEQGYRPAIVTRGIGGVRHESPHLVQASDSPALVGDEALLLAHHASCPVMIGVNRPLCVKTLQATTNCNVVISDDGLQHYRLQRDIEIAVVDGERAFGNQRLLPAGPLREPVSRLKTVDVVVVNGGRHGEFSEATQQLSGLLRYARNDGVMSLQAIQVINLNQPSINYPLQTFPHKDIRAIAGIGNPNRFFNDLTRAGFSVTSQAFPDHHRYQPRDLEFNDAMPILMTEKDAVKCKQFAKDHHWYVATTTVIDDQLPSRILTLLKRKTI